MCRSVLQMQDPATHPTDRALEAHVRAGVASSEYELRLSQSATSVRELQAQARANIPIFYMSPGCRVGQNVALHLFEPRYRILIRRSLEGNKTFAYCPARPRVGMGAVVVRVTAARISPDGRAHIVGHGIEAFQIREVWVEDGTEGLFYTKYNTAAGATGAGNSVTVVEHAASAAASRAQRRGRSRSRSCLLQ